MLAALNILTSRTLRGVGPTSRGPRRALENTMNQAPREKQQIHFKIVDTFIRIPLSGILIKFLSLRSLFTP